MSNLSTNPDLLKMYCIKVDIKNKRTILTSEKIPERETDTDVIVKVAYAGFCGTDWHIINGEFDAEDGITLGHEFVGSIADISPKYSHLVKGDRVAVNPNMSCGICIPCKRKKSIFCEEGSLKHTIGIASNGGWAEYAKVHVSLVAKVPDEVLLSQAVLCEPLSCVIHGLDKLGLDLDMGCNILVIGVGIIGLLWSCLLHVMGHRKVTVLEPNINRRQLLLKAGLGYRCTTHEELLQENPNYKADICIDCSGNAEAMQATIPLIQRGGTFLIFGVAHPDKQITINPYKLFYEEISILGVNINTPNTFERSMSYIESMSKTYLTMEILGIKTFPLSEHEAALKAFSSGSFTKIMFEV
ncbi:D-altritol 5-dehydrogenase-like [Planococcus citri]|uniref:D-altritol 5-dehydrogenase-like n=1 Tax=Planococcus citri TaxID=170843 RepID=UPI0031F861E4